MDFTQAVAIVIARELAPPMIDTLMLVSPDMQARIHAVLVCKNTRTRHDGVFDQGLDGLLRDVGSQIDHHLPTALHHAKDGWPFLLQGATTSVALESPSPSCALCALDHLWLAFMARYHIGFITPALLRCRRIDFAIPEQFGGG